MEHGEGHGVAPHDDGWGDIEEAMAASELPQVPPTSDPERLLRYVLQIHPKYSEMEMMATHLRLYATSLEQDLEQARNHSRILSSELSTEREKKQFLERYAAQIVKERNELLHARSSKRSKAAGSAHFTWHSCCKKSGEHVADLMPSMAAFRGEKLQEAMSLMRHLQDEVRNQERLRQEVNFMLKRTHREHDSKAAADRKQIQQLEKQIVQRAMLQSTLERKLYEVESALARYDTAKLQEMSALKRQLEENNARVSALESQCERYQQNQVELENERDELQDRLTNVMLLKDELADQVDHLSSELIRAQEDVDSLRGEVEVLQSEDIITLKTLYEGKLEKQREEWSSREFELKTQVDALRNELRVNDAMLHRIDKEADSAAPPLSYSVQLLSVDRSENSWTRQRDEWLRGSEKTVNENVGELVGSSLSRSQLSHSIYSDESDEDILHVSRRIGPVRSTSQRELLPRDSNWSFSGGLRGTSSHASRASRNRVSSTEKTGRDVHRSDRSFSRSLVSEKRVASDDDHFGVGSDGSADFEERLSSSHANEEEKDATSDVSEDVAEDIGGDLLADMQEMLKQFQDRRIQEEEKAEAAEKALETYRQDRDDFRNTLAPFA